MLSSTSLLLGGTFDPVHNGHLSIARAAAEAIGASNVVLVPCAQSPHKQGLTQQTPPEHRLNLLKAATAGEIFFDILTLELERGAPSYTYDTVQVLFQSGFKEVQWMIGADQVPNLPRWHRAAELMQCVRWIIVARPGYSLPIESLPENFRNLNHTIVNTPLMQISATDIRDRVRAGKSIRYLVPDGVADYIREHRLYQ